MIVIPIREYLDLNRREVPLLFPGRHLRGACLEAYQDSSRCASCAKSVRFSEL